MFCQSRIYRNLLRDYSRNRIDPPIEGKCKNFFIFSQIFTIEKSTIVNNFLNFRLSFFFKFSFFFNFQMINSIFFFFNYFCFIFLHFFSQIFTTEKNQKILIFFSCEIVNFRFSFFFKFSFFFQINFPYQATYKHQFEEKSPPSTVPNS